MSTKKLKNKSSPQKISNSNSLTHFNNKKVLVNQHLSSKFPENKSNVEDLHIKYLKLSQRFNLLLQKTQRDYKVHEQQKKQLQRLKRAIQRDGKQVRRLNSLVKSLSRQSKCIQTQNPQQEQNYTKLKIQPIKESRKIVCLQNRKTPKKKSNNHEQILKKWDNMKKTLTYFKYRQPNNKLSNSPYSKYRFSSQLPN